MTPTDTLARIREAGYRVNVTHLRLDEVQYDSFVRSETDARDGVSHMLTKAQWAELQERPQTACPMSSRGGATVVRIIPPGPDGPVEAGAVEARAVCRLTDTFSRKTGLTIALGRAIGEAQRQGFSHIG